MVFVLKSCLLTKSSLKKSQFEENLGESKTIENTRNYKYNLISNQKPLKYKKKNLLSGYTDLMWN